MTRPGIYPAFDAAEYHADPCPTPSLSASLAKIILAQSPAHARLKHPKLNPRLRTGDEKHDNDREIGSAYHAMFLGQGAEVVTIEASDWKKPSIRDERDALQSEGKIVLLAHQADTVTAMIEAASHQLVDRGYGTAFDAGSAETCLICSVGPDWFRRLVDWYTPTMIWDAKTTGASAAPDEVSRLMFSQGWPIDAAMTDFILNVIDPETAGRREYLYMIQENYAPYALTVVRMSEAAMIERNSRRSGIDSLRRVDIKSPPFTFCRVYLFGDCNRGA